MTKPGYTTTEFWATLGTYVLGVLALFVHPGHAGSVAAAVVRSVAVAAPMVASVVYAMCRTKLKVNVESIKRYATVANVEKVAADVAKVETAAKAKSA